MAGTDKTTSFPRFGDCESIIKNQFKNLFTTKIRKFQCIEFKQLFFLRELRVFVVNAFVLKRILSHSLRPIPLQQYGTQERPSLHSHAGAWER